MNIANANMTRMEGSETVQHVGTATNESGSTKPMVYTASQVSALLQVTSKTVYRLVDRGLLKTCKHLRHLRITRASVEALIK